MYLRIILRNMLSNWAGYVVALLIGFLLSPFVVHHLGNKGYGVWTLLASLTGYFGMLDLGIRSSVGRFVARYLALEDDENVNRTVSTAVAMLAAGGLLAILATLAIYLCFGVFHVDPQFEPAAKLALLIVGFNIGLTLPLGVSSAVLISLERFDVTTGVAIAGALTRSGLFILFLREGYGLVAIALITLLVSLAESTVMALWAKTLHPALRLGLRFVERGSCRELFGFGLYRFIWTVANQLIFYTDSVVIGIFLNASAITYFAIAGTLIVYGRNAVSLATDTLYPTATRLDANRNLPALQNLQILGTKIALIICLPLCLGLLFLGKQFITLWMGKEYAISAAFLAILTIPQFASMSQSGSAVLLAGMAKHRMLAYIALSEGVANVLLSIVLVRKMGVAGVAWGTVIPHLVTSAFVVPFYTLHQLNLPIGEYLEKAYLRPLLCAIPVAGYCYILSATVVKLSWFVFAAEALSVAGLFGFLVYFICLSAEQQASVLAKVTGLVHREPLVHEA